MAFEKTPEEEKLLASIRFPMSEQHQLLLLELPKTHPPGRYFAQNAIRHLNRAVKIKDQDVEMAIFRCMTAEEEIASAIFHSLKRRVYRGADRLALRSHVQKQAMHTFLAAVGDHFAESPLAKPDQPIRNIGLTFRRTPEGAQIKLSFELHLPGLEPKTGMPDMPLNFTTKDQDGPYSFRNEMLALTKAAADDLEKYLKDQAQQRNVLLYAGNDGMRKITVDIDAYCAKAQKRVLGCLTIFHLIDAHPVQGFAQQCLDAFLEMVATNKKVSAAVKAEEELADKSLDAEEKPIDPEVKAE